ncbi:MAG: sulfatase, partial [Anaerolineae bacterium]|nr:sulfatase [Anaerolineae bacterium]
GLAHRGFALNDYQQHLVHTLRRAGYYSALVGIQHIAADTAAIGYDAWPDEPWCGPRSETFHQDVVNKAVDFLTHAPQQPFFLSVGFFETHREFPEPAATDSPTYTLVPPTLPDTPATRLDMARYKASARLLDQGMGAVLTALQSAGLADSTLVICTTDHGLAFPGMKTTLTDHGLGVMLIMRGPDGFNGGRVLDAMVSQVDLFPTLCEWLAIEPPPWLQGQSMLPLIRDEVAEINEAIFGEVNYHAAYEPQRAVRTQRWKYIRRYDHRRRPVLPNIDDSLSKDVWLAYGFDQRPVAAEQLYDLMFDPTEAHNLADDPAMAEVLDDMRGRLNRWMQATDDPLLQGPIAPPPGAVFNDPDGLSPKEPVLRSS